MVLLNLFSSPKSLQFKNNCRTLFLFLGVISVIQAEVIPFFNPTQTYQQNTANVNIQGFVANDPVSIKGFFNDWNDDYTPRNGDNIAMEEFRLDVGTTLYDKYYIGYFYTRNLLSSSNKGFVDFYHAIKNDTGFKTVQNYKIRLDMAGIEQHGILLSRNFPLYDTEEHTLTIGTAAYVSYATDIQRGSLNGTSSIALDQTYNATASTDYYYMNNLLYDLDVQKTYGLGYGLHLGLFYANKVHDFDLQIIVNDLAAKSHWRNLPFSHVDIETFNQEINPNGYVEYNPTIRGIEESRDYSQNIKPKYHIDIKKHFSQKIDFVIGLDSIEQVNIPYIAISKILNEKQKVELLYETRFNSIRIGYENTNFNISILSNGFTKASAIGLSGSYIYHF